MLILVLLLLVLLLLLLLLLQVAFSGVDPAQHVASTGQQCGNLRWVPYEDLVYI